MIKIKIGDEKYLKRKLKVMIGAILLAGCLTACDGTELSDVIPESATVIETNDGEFETAIKKEKVNGEDFKLVVEYSCFDTGDKDQKWRITSDKQMRMCIYTEGLEDGYKVYIDNIHTDTLIGATNKFYDGIMQDTMDDRIHNSLMLGFPIGNDIKYYGTNIIEGQNSEFIEGFAYGYAGHNSGSLTQKRRLESDFLEEGVYANHIISSIGLLIQGPNDDEPRGVDVFSEIYVEVCNEIEFLIDDEIEVRRYDRNGNYEVISKTSEDLVKTYKK